MKESLNNNLTPAVVRKFYTLARFFLKEENEECKKALDKWLREGDGSRFSRGHLELAEFRELKSNDRLKIIAMYSKSPISYVIIFHIFNFLRKPELQSQCKLILNRYNALDMAIKKRPLIIEEIMQSNPALLQSINDGIYDADCIMDKTVFYFLINSNDY